MFAFAVGAWLVAGGIGAVFVTCWRFDECGFLKLAATFCFLWFPVLLLGLVLLIRKYGLFKLVFSPVFVYEFSLREYVWWVPSWLLQGGILAT